SRGTKRTAQHVALARREGGDIALTLAYAPALDFPFPLNKLQVLQALAPVWANDQQHHERGNHEGDQQTRSHNGERDEGASGSYAGIAWIMVEDQPDAEERCPSQRACWHEDSPPPFRTAHLRGDIQRYRRSQRWRRYRLRVGKYWREIRPLEVRPRCNHY